MVIVEQYTTTEEREQILRDKSSLHLWEEQNITGGNFLIFVDRERIDDEPIPTE